MSINQSTAFTPRALVPTKVGGVHVNLYPIVDESMGVHERAYAHHVNKTNLCILDVTPRQMLTALGHQIGQSTFIEGKMSDFLRRFEDQWSNLQLVKILSFHNSIGDPIVDTCIAGSRAILLPIQNGVVGNCRRGDIRFVYVRANVDYSDKIDGPMNRFIIEYFIELPQSTYQLLNGGGVAYSLTTFGGPDNLNTYTSADIQTHIVSHTLQQFAARLVEPKFGSLRATLDTRAARKEIEDGILSLGTTTILKSSFISTAPNYTTQPHAAIDLIHQVNTGSDGKPIIYKIQKYHSLLTQACHPFANEPLYPINVCSKFMQNMDPTLQPIFRRIYSNHSDVVPLDSTTQRKYLQLMLQAAQQAEDNRESIIAISQQQIQTQAFMFHASGGSTPAFPSQAEKTLADTKPPGTRPAGASGDRRYACHGCGEFTHGYNIKNNDGTWIIVCPNKDKPGVAERAVKSIADMRERLKTRRKDQKKDKRKRKFPDGATTATYASLTDDEKKKVKAEYAASLAPPSSSSSGPQIYCIDVQFDNVQVYNASAQKRMMPIAVSSNLPHVQFQLGHTLHDPNCPITRVAVDTCAAISTGSTPYLLSLAKQFPQCVEKIFGPSDYAAITLTGVVTGNETPVSTSLDTVFQFHLPYKTKDGESCSIQIAAGTNVAVNIILGLPFIQKMKCTLDFVDNVLECKALDCPPFPFEFRRTSNHVPVAAHPAVHTSGGMHSEIVHELNHLEQYFIAKQNQPPERSFHQVHFGSKLESSNERCLKREFAVDQSIDKSLTSILRQDGQW